MCIEEAMSSCPCPLVRTWLVLLAALSTPVLADSGPVDGCAKGSENTGIWKRLSESYKKHLFPDDAPAAPPAPDHGFRLRQPVRCGRKSREPDLHLLERRPHRDVRAERRQACTGHARHGRDFSLLNGGSNIWLLLIAEVTKLPFRQKYSIRMKSSSCVVCEAISTRWGSVVRSH
jgi:hypothetical protein